MKRFSIIVRKNAFACRRLYLAVFIFLLAVTITTESKAIEYMDHTYIPVQTVVQEQTCWCWSAAALAIIYYYDDNESVRQCDIVNWEKNKTDCCDLPTPEHCNVGGNFDTEDNMLEHWGVSASVFDGAFTAWESGFYLWAEKPFIIGWEWDSGGAHDIVAIGFQAANGVWGVPVFLSFMNPWMGSSGGKWTAFHDWVVDGDGDSGINQSAHEWIHTTYAHTTAPDDVTLRKTYEYVGSECVEVVDDNAWYYYANDELTAKEFTVTTKDGDTNPLTDQMLGGCTWYSAGTRVRLKPGFQVDSGTCFRAFTD